MRKRYFKITMGLVLLLMYFIGDICVEYLQIQDVKSNRNDYVLTDARVLDQRYKGRSYCVSVIQYEYKGEIRNGEVRNDINDVGKGNISIAICKLNEKITRMNIAFSFDKICMILALLCAFLAEFLMYKIDEKKLNIRKAREMEQILKNGSNEGTAIINKENYNNIKNEYTREIRAVITKLKRECEVDYDYIWVWCETDEVNGGKRKFKSGKVIETRKWSVGDVITVLLSNQNEKNI